MSVKLSLVAALALSATGFANTYVVDDTPGPGVDFPDIAAAVAFAQPGDVLLVRDGTYGGFVLDKRLIVVGTGNVQVTSGIEVRNIPAGPRAAIVHVRVPSFVVDACAGPVLLQELGDPATGRIADSSDVRIARTRIVSGLNEGIDALHVLNSRVELVDGNARGQDGRPSDPPHPAVSGGTGVVLTSARFVAAFADIRGGNAIDEPIANRPCGSGGNGIVFMDNASMAIVLGPSTVSAGPGAHNWPSFDCLYDSCPGYAVTAQTAGSTFIYSNTTLPTFDCEYGHQCWMWTVPAISSGVNVVQSVPTDPTLTVVGTPTPGATIMFEVRGEVGATASLNVGRGLTVSPTAGVTIERLVAGGRVFGLGHIPASGFVTKTIPLPATLPPGFVICAQAEVVGSGGTTRTNSTPIVLR